MNTQSQAVVLERIYPHDMDMNDVHDQDSLRIHEARYEFAATQLRGEQILDMACGCGFGTALMAAKHPKRQFTGVDIDPVAIDYAREHYSAPNLQYLCADAMTFASGIYNSIVSLETIEHLSDAKGFIARLPELLEEGGRIIASVPVTPTCDGNPHHLHDFSQRSFKRLFAKQSFVPGEEFRQVQPWVYKDAFSKSEQSSSRSKGVGNNVLAYYRRRPQALFARIISLILHGSCNVYLTASFQRN